VGPRHDARDGSARVAHYCHENNLDPVRHVEILGGRIYLTASCTTRRARAHPRRRHRARTSRTTSTPTSGSTSSRRKGDEWAKEEHDARIRERIQHNVPEKALAAVVQRFRIAATAPIVGVNWCGGGVEAARPGRRRRADEDGADARAAPRVEADRRRDPGYAEIIRPLEAHRAHRERAITSSEPEPVAQSNADTEDDLLAQDREILRAESEG
jgi:hypothetical protein